MARDRQLGAGTESAAVAIACSPTAASVRVAAWEMQLHRSRRLIAEYAEN